MAPAGSAAPTVASGSIVHLRCGDDILGKLAAAGLPGQFRRWADALCQGPTPAGLSYHEWLAVRARFLANAYGLTLDAAATHLASDDANLEPCREADEVVLWLEHDLYDQIVLVHLLQRLARMGVARERLRLICVGAHPAVPRFIGLGQLDAEQLAALFPKRRVVRAAQIQLAQAAWAAWTAPDPASLLALLDQDTSALPFLAPGLRRHLQDFPDRRSGLALTERLALEAVRGGAGTGADIFRAVQAREKAPWMGDTMLYSVLRRLGSGATPLLAAADDAGPLEGVKLGRRRLGITGDGERVLAGEADWVALAGIDRWLAGVHLAGHGPVWRRDETGATVIMA
jgi:hypothetical protein